MWWSDARCRRFTSSLLLAGVSVAVFGVSTAGAATPPGGRVSWAPITAAELLSGAQPRGLTRNARFAPGLGANRAPALNGTLHFAGVTMGILSDASNGKISNPVGGKDTTFFPNVSISFFTVGSHLVPTTQDVIRNGVLPHTRSYWDVIVQPGRVWTQPGDHGWHRASFPFALVNSIEGETHTGIALFLYREGRVSHVRFQVVQETSPYDVPEYFTAWGSSAARLRLGVRHLDMLKHRFIASEKAQLPERPWRMLRARAGRWALHGFASYSDVIQSAAVVGGKIYRTNCPTAAGPFPYCSAVRYGVWSVTKSSFLNVAMLRLAEKYGTRFLNSSIAPYVPGADRPGWRDVTFADLANMASGHGPAGNGTCYLCDYTRWYLAPSESRKTAQALNYPRFRKPGTLYNYRDQDAYLLAVAENNLLRSHAGPHASIWNMLRNEVYRPIGIFTAPTNSTIEPHGPGLPLGAYGYYPTLDDLAKISALYEHRGSWNGHKILNRRLVSRLLPRATVPPGSLPASTNGSESYLFDWHIMRITPTSNCTRYMPQMEGWGGNTVTVLPRSTTLIRMRNNWIGDPSNPQIKINALAAQLSPICP
jgi:CubicO group peptidase (beta-lactamase class C family)